MNPTSILGLVEGAADAGQAWRFRFTLSDGRRYEEWLEDPGLESWLGAHLRAFRAFSGVPPTVELSAIPPGLADERTRRAWADLIEHFAASPREPLPDGLLPLPERPYEIPDWKLARLHPDCHVLYGGAFYSAPYRLIGRPLVVRGGAQEVTLFDRGVRVAKHPRALHPGERRSDPGHYPPPALAALLPAPRRIRDDASRLGPSVGRVVDSILGERPVEGLRAAQGVVHLARRYGMVRLEEACQWALASGHPSYRAVRYALRKGDPHDAHRRS